jgi:RNA polymerase sigma-70 factor, ECF subfamily
VWTAGRLRAVSAGHGSGDATKSQEPGGAAAGNALPAQRSGSVPPAGNGARGASIADGVAVASDKELLARHVAGDPDAFGELFARHKDRLWAVAVRTLADPEDAADALQDAMISAFRRADSFRGDSAVTTWLHRIVVNACLDKMRRRTARPEVSGSDERFLDTMAATDAGSDPATGSDVSLEVMAALRQLPHDQQAALVLVDMLDYPVAEAAQVLGVAEGTIKSRCARGRARLLPKLGHLRQSGPAAASGASVKPAERADQPALGHPNQQTGNRFTAGSVLPAQEGSDESN